VHGSSSGRRLLRARSRRYAEGVTPSSSSGRLVWPVLLLVGGLAWLVLRAGGGDGERQAHESGEEATRETEDLPAPTLRGVDAPRSLDDTPPATPPREPVAVRPYEEALGALGDPEPSLPGRVVDREGHGRQATISVWHLDPASGAFEPLRHVESYDDGRFDIDRRDPVERVLSSQSYTPLPDVPLIVLAESARHGTGATHVDAPRDPTVQTVIVLDGPGVLRGRVLDGAGAGAAGVRLVIDLAGLRAPGDRSDEVADQTLAARLEGGGLVRSTVTTDVEGRFEVSALRHAAYEIRAEVEAGEVLLTRVPADGRELVLSLTRPHLVVRVLDEAGEPWLCPPIYPPRGLPVDWPKTPHLALLRVGGEDAPWGVLDDTRARTVGEASVFELAPGARYLVGLVGGQEPWDPLVVEARDGRTDVELRVKQTLRPGTLVVTADLRPGSLGAAVRLRLEDPRTGFALVQVDALEFGADPPTVTAPAGDWRLVVEGQAWYDMTGRRLDRGAFGRFETRVEIRPDERTPVHVALPEGARLALTATCHPCAPDAVADGDLGPDGVAVTLGDANHWHTAVRFEPPPAGPDDPGWDPMRSRARPPTNLRLGVETIAEGLPAGQWTLLGRLADGRTARTEVVLVDGETTEARLVFE
jgi:hypothetical protein